ncbi:MAG: phosphomannomutase/phosphoglucomutase [Pseudomonadota bacterium]
MTFPHEIFKAYDIRGIVDHSLTETMCFQIGSAIGSEALQQLKREVVVGRDGRLTGKRLATALGDGIMSAGCDVIEIGQVPTPALYYATQLYGTGTGVQVTGSHNPPEYNGLKMMVNGTTLSGEAIQNLKRRIIDNDITKGQGSRQQRTLLPDYVNAIVEDVNLHRTLKVVLDAGNGVAGGCAPEVFRRLGCDVVELFCEVDGNFPNHHPDPSQLENLQDLIAAVRQHDADFGMAFDGDGDRLGVITPDGEVVWPDRQMVLFAGSILAHKPGSEIIFDVKCSRILPEAIRTAGGIPTMWKTGHSFIKSKLKETGAALAGEMSGHIFFNDRWGGFDDGIYAGARLCELMTEESRSPGEVFESLPNTVNTPELRIELDEGEHYALVERLVDAAKFSDAEVSKIDGLRVDFDDGFGLVRASNTTPMVIMRFEADSDAALDGIKNRFRDLFASVDNSLKLPF